ncbi:NADH-ubiquinone oxidoreductase chain 6 [Platanthera guangdongensis]|uniref:NADH-ubiquinone oxidoreductase chain 6 n=1 Tax=Platanthera guangdongensis TaxID=2320717 RepID=A0ABR2MZE7_9ASPA
MLEQEDAFKFHFKEGQRIMILSVSSSPALVSGLMAIRAKNLVHSVSFPIPVFRDTVGLLIFLESTHSFSENRTIVKLKRTPSFQLFLNQILEFRVPFPRLEFNPSETFAAQATSGLPVVKLLDFFFSKPSLPPFFCQKLFRHYILLSRQPSPSIPAHPSPPVTLHTTLLFLLHSPSQSFMAAPTMWPEYHLERASSPSATETFLPCSPDQPEYQMEGAPYTVVSETISHLGLLRLEEGVGSEFFATCSKKLLVILTSLFLIVPF